MSRSSVFTQNWYNLYGDVSAGSSQIAPAPLVSTASGAKFGKSEKGAIWLDPALTSPDEIDAGSDVPPLIAAAHLDGAALAPEQVQEIVRLEQHVAELGVRDARVEPRLHRLLLEHHVHAEVLADVAQEVHEALLPEPFGDRKSVV